nr:retrovirus-related Pol polyprotein from transposon TNT 1-94 [Tanacetum cinerariifolium]
GTINWGLWYSKETTMALMAYVDADHAGYQDTRRSTSGSAQFLGDKLLMNIFTKALPRERFECLLLRLGMKNTMADVNVNAPANQAPTMAPPTRTNDQIVPCIRWQFWDTVLYDKTARCYKCQLDEQWFDLTKDTLRDALQITPVNNNNKAFSSPPSSDALINFVNELGYPKLVRNLSNVITNDMFQSWRALTTIINLCLMGKTPGKHKFHPRLDSPLHLPNEEPVLRYLKFCAKGTKREVFGMPIPDNLITADIQGKPYYQEYLEKVVKHQRYLADEQRSDLDSPAPKPTKATKKSKLSAPKADLRPPVTKPASSQQPEPKPAPTKPCSVTKRRKPTSSLRSIDESVDEGIPEKEPRVDDEEADVQRALEESLKGIYDAPRGMLPPMVIKEAEFGKYQPLPEVQGKDKEKPPPPPPPAGPSGTLGSPRASGSSQVPLTPPPPPSTNQEDLEYLRYGSKVSRPAFSISKMKVAYYLDVGLEQMMPDQMWIDEECKYDISAIAVRTHMRILSVVRIEVFSMYGYDYINNIVLRRTDLSEHIIAERDFKYLYPSDFKDLYLLNLQGHLNHLPPKYKKILTIAVNLWTRHLVIRQRVEDFQLGIESYQTQDRYGVQIIMRFNEIHKFNDDTLHQIDEAFDYRVKEFKKWLKTRRIFHTLESFIGGRVRDGHYRLLKYTE